MAEQARSSQAAVVEFEGDEDMVAAVQPVPGHPWSVVLIRPSRVLYAAAFEMQRGLYWTLGLTALGLTILAVLFSRHLGGRLRLVFDVAETLRAGKEVALDTLGGDEIGRIARTLSQISMELHQSRQALLEHQQNLEGGHPAHGPCGHRPVPGLPPAVTQCPHERDHRIFAG